MRTLSLGLGFAACLRLGAASAEPKPSGAQESTSNPQKVTSEMGTRLYLGTFLP